MLKKSVERFVIPFRGLKNGEHTFSFRVTDTFFTEFEKSTEISQGNVEVQVVVVKEPRLLTLNFSLKGTVIIPCDRCMERYELPIEYNDQLVVKFGASFEEIEANVLIIPEEEGVLVLNQLIYEFLHLALPTRRVHPDNASGSSTCDPLMLQKLNELLPHPLEEDELPDPRWSVLKDLKNFN